MFSEILIIFCFLGRLKPQDIEGQHKARGAEEKADRKRSGGRPEDVGGQGE